MCFNPQMKGIVSGKPKNLKKVHIHMYMPHATYTSVFSPSQSYFEGVTTNIVTMLKLLTSSHFHIKDKNQVYGPICLMHAGGGNVKCM